MKLFNCLSSMDRNTKRDLSGTKTFEGYGNNVIMHEKCAALKEKQYSFLSWDISSSITRNIKSSYLFTVMDCSYKIFTRVILPFLHSRKLSSWPDDPSRQLKNAGLSVHKIPNHGLKYSVRTKIFYLVSSKHLLRIKMVPTAFCNP